MEKKETSGIENVVTGGFCIGCGACAVQDNKIRMRDTSFGLPEASIASTASNDEVCPFSSKLSENEISRELFAATSHYDVRVGYYIGNYVGYVNDTEARVQSSSGGVVTWVLTQLLVKNEIDGVIHVGRRTDGGYHYLISETVDDIQANAKSRYYPVSFDTALKSILGNGKKYAFVGTPCFVKAIRLLAKNNEAVAESVKYCIAIFCGHMKTKGFSEMIALQQGVSLSSLKYVDFRVKNMSAPASRYSTQVYFTGPDKKCAELAPVSVNKLYGMDWGLGYFKALACDWCDDIAGETADLSCGDAWLPETVSEPRGTNILITRNRMIHDIVSEGYARGELSITPVGVDKIYESQAGNFRHRREGLAVRIADSMRKDVWRPSKRIKSSDFQVGARRRAIYRLREYLAKRSHTAFLEARDKNSFLLFMLKMLPFEFLYVVLNGRIFRGFAKIMLQYLNYANARR